jgi:hypothetical protein
MRDWKAMAEAQGIELSDSARERLEGLEKRMLGLRGLIDWMEEPSLVCPMPEGPEDGE